MTPDESSYQKKCEAAAVRYASDEAESTDVALCSELTTAFLAGIKWARQNPDPSVMKMITFVKKSHHLDKCTNRNGMNCNCGKHEIELIAQFEETRKK